MVLSFNKDDKNLGWWGVCRDKLPVCYICVDLNIHDETSYNFLSYVWQSISYCCTVRYVGLVLVAGRMNANFRSVFL